MSAYFPSETAWDRLNSSWNSIFPDPEMAGYSEFNPGTVPDMLLYNSDNNHYDLLVEDSSRLAVLGLITLGTEKEYEKDIKENVLGKEEMV